MERTPPWTAPPAGYWPLDGEERRELVPPATSRESTPPPPPPPSGQSSSSWWWLLLEWPERRTIKISSSVLERTRKRRNYFVTRASPCQVRAWPLRPQVVARADGWLGGRRVTQAGLLAGIKKGRVRRLAVVVVAVPDYPTSIELLSQLQDRGSISAEASRVVAAG